MVVKVRISTRGRYGVNAVYELAKNYGGEPMSIKQISELNDIPLPYLEQLIMQLRKAEVVRSIRGAKGGYVLNIDPKELSVLTVLEVLEGEIVPVQCKDEESCAHCRNNKMCPGEIVWDRIHNAIIDAVKDFTYYQLVNEYSKILD